MWPASDSGSRAGRLLCYQQLSPEPFDRWLDTLAMGEEENNKHCHTYLYPPPPRLPENAPGML